MAKSKITYVSYARVIGGGEIYLSFILPRLSSHFDQTLLAGKKLQKLVGKEVKFRKLYLFPIWLEKIMPRTFQLRKLYYRTYFSLTKPFTGSDIVSLQDFDGAIIEAINKRPLILTTHTRFQIPREFDESVVNWLKKVDKIICVSEQTKKDYLARGVPADKCIVIHNSIDVASYSPNSQPGEYITWIGRVEEADKNPSLFIEIAKLAQAKNLDYRFRVVGDGSYLSELKAQSRGLTNLEFYGFCQPDLMPTIYKQANLLCMTSTSEGTPFVALEAMASGVPIIATNVGGLPEIISNQKNGILIDGFDEEIFLNEITKIFEDKDLYSQIQKAARKTIESDFSIERMIEQIKAVYNSLIDKKQDL